MEFLDEEEEEKEQEEEEEERKKRRRGRGRIGQCVSLFSKTLGVFTA